MIISEPEYRRKMLLLLNKMHYGSNYSWNDTNLNKYDVEMWYREGLVHTPNHIDVDRCIAIRMQAANAIWIFIHNSEEHNDKQ